MTNILVTEDNADYRRLIKIYLKRAGFQVFEADDGVQALKLLSENPIHLLIADVMMPHMDGFELTKEIRDANYTLPILIITAKTTLDDKREGFRTGADDYMTKPIDMEEMILRVEALLRRANIAADAVLNISGCVLQEDTLKVTFPDSSTGTQQTIQLRQKEFFLLQKLLSYPDRIFTRQALMDEIWGFDTETDPRTVDVHIKRLREHFSNQNCFEIQTIRGLGYKAVVY